jgi:hypothetical protein
MTTLFITALFLTTLFTKTLFLTVIIPSFLMRATKIFFPTHHRSYHYQHNEVLESQNSTNNMLEQ